MGGYAHPEVLVTTDWVKANLGKPGIRLVEVNVDTQAYAAGHIPGAVGWNWQTQTQDQVTRDIPTQEAFERLMGESGITPGDTVVLYGDNNNWFAAYAFWLLKMYGHKDVRLMDGGRVKWLAENDKPMNAEQVTPARSSYKAQRLDTSARARLSDVLEIARSRSQNLVDVRSPDEYSGKVVAPPGMTETAQRGGHVPGARSVPWSQTVKADGSFKPVEELSALYFDKAGLDRNKSTVAYCRIGERSSHTWFVLTYLMGMKGVRNYDGSWTEYGSVIGAPIEKGA